MPRVNFPTIGDIEDYEFLQGTIKTIDSSTDTCTVEVDGSVIPALLFYHCLPDSQLRENGAIEGSAAGFAEEDAVIVQLKHDRSVARVVAHVDGVKSCGYQFLLIRGDNTPVDETLLSYLHVVERKNGIISLIDADIKYNSHTGYFMVTLKNPQDNNPNGLFFHYYCTDGLATQYPYRYNVYNQYLDADRIKPGIYKDTIPYFVVNDGTLIFYYGNFGIPLQTVPPAITVTTSVVSTVPYRIVYNAQGYIWDDVATVKSGDDAINETWQPGGWTYMRTSSGSADYPAGSGSYTLTLNALTNPIRLGGYGFLRVSAMAI